MSSQLGPSWSLRSTASPRCLTAYVTTTNTTDSSSGVGGGDSSNPFDDRQTYGNNNNNRDDSSGYIYSVAFGTERGSLHYRNYPPTGSLSSNSTLTSGGGRIGGRSDLSTRGQRIGDTSQLFIDPISTNNNTLSEYGQLNLQGAVKGSIVGIVHATSSSPSLSSSVVSSTGMSSVANTNNNNNTTPVFLLLVDDNRTKPPTAQSSNSNLGAYAAHLITIKNGSFHKLPAAPTSSSNLVTDGGVTMGSNNKPPQHTHRRGGSGPGSSSGSGNLSSWVGGDAGGGQGTATQSSQQQQALSALPRMSCATYHVNSGYIYASGTGVYGLSNQAVKAVLAGMSSTISLGNDGGYSRRQNNKASQASTAQQQHPPMAIYLKCNHALPLPGVRCSSSSSGSSGSGSGGSNKNSMTLACSGRVAIVAVTNAFYAVPSYLDYNVIKSIVTGTSSTSVLDEQQYQQTSNSSLPNVTATKLISFAQSSQVHPVIAMEVITNDLTPPTSSSSSDLMKYYLRPITSLILLASGRECTTIQLVSIPNPDNVSSILNKGGSVVGGMISTSIKSSSSMERGGRQHGGVKQQQQIMATLPSPILAATALHSTRANNSSNTTNSGGDLSSGPLVALLTVDGLVHIRSPFCIAVPLTSIEVGTRPNDFFALSSLPSPNNVMNRNLVATSYAGEARLISCHVETPQDFADRLIKLCIDAFGSNGFPRLELAEALGATFSATSYSGPEPTVHKRLLLKQYLESVLGLADDLSLQFSSSSSSSGTSRGKGDVSIVISDDGQESGLEVTDGQVTNQNQDDNYIKDATATTDLPSSLLGANSLLTCTALLCLVCYQLNPPNGTAACRASKVCASAMGTVRPKDSGISKAAMSVCELVADRLLKEVSTSSSSSSSNNRSAAVGSSASMELVESAVWLLRSCGCHQKAIDVLQERMNSPAFRNALVGSSSIGASSSSGGGGWSQIKFDSYIATHLGELWSSRDEQCCQLVLSSSATRDLISRNPTLGLSVFTTLHPQNEKEWEAKKASSDDPLAHPLYPTKVVDLLKSINPQESSGGANQELRTTESFSPRSKGSRPLPIESGRALAVTFLESAIGIATGRPSSQDTSSSSTYQPESRDIDERKADLHDELSYLLLEGVISERGDLDKGEDSTLGSVYRFKLRRLLSWPNSKIRAERLLGSLPSSFLREHALLLGRLGRHEDALKILYSQENSLELALEYCDVRHERRQAQIEEAKARGDSESMKRLQHECAYIPLVRVALSSDTDTDRGTAAAIQVLALRRNSIDKAAALRLLPKNLPVSSLVRPFLIPAVVEDQSQVRRLTMTSSLLRSRYVNLKQKLTEAQLKSQSSIQTAPALQKLNLGDPLHSSKPIRARPVHAASQYYPDVMLTKHFFHRHLVIQAQIMNNSSSQGNNSARTLANVAFVVAESSDEALVPTMELPLKTIPPGATGSVWCVMAASPQRLDGAAYLTCELRFTVLEVDAETGTPLDFNEGLNASDGFGRTYVEELQDIDIRHTEFG